MIGEDWEFVRHTHKRREEIGPNVGDRLDLTRLGLCQHEQTYHAPCSK
jgi:hypothetical protein